MIRQISTMTMSISSTTRPSHHCTKMLSSTKVDPQSHLQVHWPPRPVAKPVVLHKVFNSEFVGRQLLIIDKRIVDEPSSTTDVWSGPVNKPMPDTVWKINRERAIDYLNTRSRIYVFDGYAGWDPRYRIKVRVVLARGLHFLFMPNMPLRPSQEQMKTYGSPDFTIYNAGAF